MNTILDAWNNSVPGVPHLGGNFALPVMLGRVEISIDNQPVPLHKISRHKETGEFYGRSYMRDGRALIVIMGGKTPCRMLGGFEERILPPYDFPVSLGFSKRDQSRVMTDRDNLVFDMVEHTRRNSGNQGG